MRDRTKMLDLPSPARVARDRINCARRTRCLRSRHGASRKIDGDGGTRRDGSGDPKATDPRRLLRREPKAVLSRGGACHGREAKMPPGRRHPHPVHDARPPGVDFDFHFLLAEYESFCEWRVGNPCPFPSLTGAMDPAGTDYQPYPYSDRCKSSSLRPA
jgi:hypothetical protein